MAKLASIVASYFTDESLASDSGPKATFVIGQLCAGKTTHRKQHCGGEFVLLDAGDVYLKLNNGSWTDFGKHLESEVKQACIAIVGRVVFQKRNIVCELLVDNEETARAFGAVWKGLADLGYDIGIADVDCDLETAKRRNAERAENNISSYYTTSYHLNAFLGILKAKQSGELESGRCDVCGDEVKYPEGHLLTTRQVVGTPWYWEKLYGMQLKSLRSRGISSFDEFRKDLGVKTEFAESVAGEATPWMICNRCVSMFPVGAEVTHLHAKRWWESIAVYDLPGVGPVPLSAVNMGDASPTSETVLETAATNRRGGRRRWEFWKGSSKRLQTDEKTMGSKEKQ